MLTAGSKVTTPLQLPFQNTYARLPERLFARVDPVPVAEPQLIKLNERVARMLGLDPEQLRSPEGVAVLGGSLVAEGSEPLAMAYAGHQFGYFSGQLGDGRANLLGEIAGFDIQLKGSGRTPFSRGGDGRAALGPVLREYILSESMWAMGVPTTQSLAAVLTGEAVWRESPLPGAVLTRVARSHVRVGTFQYFAAREDHEAVRTLTEYTIARHYPEVASSSEPARALLAHMVARHAQLVAQWMLLGFVHGVMNTDNCSVAGETIDYGPCAFLEEYDPKMVFSSIDQYGRYAYENQPGITLWNLTRFAETILPLIREQAGVSQEEAVELARETLMRFEAEYTQARIAGLRKKLGLATEQAGDVELAEDLLACMADGHADYTLVFRRLAGAAEDSGQDHAVAALLQHPEHFTAWAARWHARLRQEGVSAPERANAMRAANPVYIPRNHLVEEAIAAATATGNFGPFEQLLEAVSQPYTERANLERYATPAQPSERVTKTFCGT